MPGRRGCPYQATIRFSFALARARPHQAGLRMNIRLMFQAMVTRLHSPRALSSPRNEN
jgi:hypothetical protein